MNLKWNIDNIYSKIGELTQKLYATTDENIRCLICNNIYAYILLLRSTDIKKVDINDFKLNDIDLLKYKNIYEQNSENEKNRFIKLIYSNYDAFFKLIKDEAKPNIKSTSFKNPNKFIIDSKSIYYLKTFLINMILKWVIILTIFIVTVILILNFLVKIQKIMVYV